MGKVKKFLKSSIDSAYRASTASNDWAFWGGLANGIAGPGAGLAVGSDIKQRNEQNRQEARQSYNELSDSYQKTEKSIEACAKIVAEIDSKLFDDSSPDEFFKLLNFSDVGISVTEGRNFSVSGKIICNNKIELLGKECILDGSLEIEILDKNNNTVAKGYYPAPGKDFERVAGAGFKDGMSFNALCWSDEFCDDDIKKEDYTYRITRHNMWKIEI